MNTRLYALAFVVGMLSASTVWLLLFLFQLGTPVNTSSRWTGESLAIKQHAARLAVEPKLGIVSGSSGHFSISAQQMEQALGLPVVNLALHAGLGLPYILRKAQDVLCEGDIALLAPEYEVFNGNGNGRPSELLIDHVVAQDREYFRSASLGEQWALVSGIGPGRLVKGFLTRLGFSLPPPTTGYSASTISPWGDEKANEGSRYEGPARALQVANVSQSSIGAREILEFLRWAKAEKVSVVASFPPFPRNVEGQSPQVFQQVLSFWEEQQVPVLGTPGDYFYADDAFFDTRYHLNVEGRKAHTQTLLENLSELAVTEAQLARQGSGGESDRLGCWWRDSN